MFQSTPPRGKRHDQRRIHSTRTVSIHAPAREATRAGWQAREGQEVSIHAPAREATRSASERCRQPIRRFNPRPRAGSDADSVLRRKPRMFQSTPPRGKRRGGRVMATVNGSFNPRPRAGSDLNICRQAERGGVSIHAPAREATQRRPGAVRLQCAVSIHAPAREATSPERRLLYILGVSIHAPAREATCRHPRRSTLCGTCRFNPRPRAGSDVQRAPLGLSYDVSIHAPAREATPGRLVLIHGGLEVSIHAPAREATWL